MRRIVSAGALVLALLSTALVPAMASTPAPTGLPSFYAVPTFSKTAKIGSVLKYEKVTPAPTGLNGTTYRIMYISQNYLKKPVAVTGFMVIPSGKAPAGGWKVVAYGHGTNGMADQCAESQNPGSTEVSNTTTNIFLSHGWALTYSDYQGEGTPGLMPYLAAVSAAQDTINSVRAAHSIALAHVGTTYMVWGHSEGGQTAVFANHIGKAYAPELTLKGVVAGAPPSQFAYIYGALQTTPYAYYLIMGAAGLNAYYGNTIAPLDQVMTPLAMSMLPDLETGCSAKISADVRPYVNSHTLNLLIKADPYTLPAWRKVLNWNDPAAFSAKSTVPLLMIQGGSDAQIPVASTALLFQELCPLGQTLQRWIYPGQSHSGVNDVAYQDMITWMTHRFAGKATPDAYVPVGLNGVTPAAQTCN